MDDFRDRTGFITGGAGGIGLGMARALGRRGMTLVLTDIEGDTLEASAQALRNEGMTVHTEVLDVGDPEAYADVAHRTLERHGTLHFLFNNAGVAGPSPLGQSRFEDWRWVIDVNLMGVVHGIELFLPAMQASGEEGYIINTASLAGHLGNPGMASYCATKFAVVGYSEVLRQELAASAIGVSVLCPAWVKTRIADSMRNHPSGDHAPVDGTLSTIDELIANEGMTVEALCDRVIRGMAEHTFYLFSHADFWPAVEERLERIRQDYQRVLT